jgi:hypothetical protein
MAGARQFDLGYRRAGEIVQVRLRGSSANVMLVDASNLSNYKAGRRVSGLGGLVTRSPYQLAIPRSGTWYVLVTMDGLRGSTSASVQVIRPARPLPPARTNLSARSPLYPIREAADEYADVSSEGAPSPDEKPYDVFVCHAFADKEEIVRPLVSALGDAGLSVWYDESSVAIGDNLRRKIDAGLVRSRFGLVVLSPAFFSGGWKQYELDGLVSLEVGGERQVILPVWHNVTAADVLAHSPSLAAKVARSTAEYSVEQIAAEVAEVAKRER